MRCARAGETLRPLLGCSPRCSRWDRCHHKQTPFQRELWTNKKVTEFGASTTTLAAFQTGQHNLWLAAEMCGEQADTAQRGCKRIQLCQKNPVRQENALHSREQRYSLTSDRIAPASLRKPRSPRSIPHGSDFAKPQSPESLHRDRFYRTARGRAYCSCPPCAEGSRGSGIESAHLRSIASTRSAGQPVGSTVVGSMTGISPLLVY